MNIYIYIFVYIHIERICIQLYVNNTIQYKPMPFHTMNILCLNQYLYSTCTNVQRPSPESCFDCRHTAGCFVSRMVHHIDIDVASKQSNISHYDICSYRWDYIILKTFQTFNVFWAKLGFVNRFAFAIFDPCMFFTWRFLDRWKLVWDSDAVDLHVSWKFGIVEHS